MDLEAIRKIDSAYVWIVKELRPHQFIDLTFRVGNGGIVPIFRADRAELPERQVQYDEPANVAPLQPKRADTTDYENEILNILRKEPLHQTGIGRIRYLDSMGKGKVLYYVRDPNLSPIHDYMQKEAVSILTASGVTVSKTNSTGDGSVPDIETPEFDLEIETGLKHSKADLQERLSKSAKRMIDPGAELRGSGEILALRRGESQDSNPAGAKGSHWSSRSRSKREQSRAPSRPLKEGGEPTRRVGEGT